VGHPLHEVIGSFLQQLPLPADCRLLLARECGGNQNLPLFCSQQKSNYTEYCNFDALVVKRGEISFLMEIEESGLIPTKVCGKFLTAALSTHFIHDVLNNAATPMGSHVTFVQILDSSKLPRRTKKIQQGSLLEQSIQNILPCVKGPIKTYRLFFIDGVEGFHADHSEFQQVFMKACG